MTSRGLIAVILAFSLGALAGATAIDVGRVCQVSNRSAYLDEQIQQLGAINKAQANELRQLKDERGE